MASRASRSSTLCQSSNLFRTADDGVLSGPAGVGPYVDGVEKLDVFSTDLQEPWEDLLRV